jgi:lipid-A-disaccharide synthase-like uncharacterized protein
MVTTTTKRSKIRRAMILGKYLFCRVSIVSSIVALSYIVYIQNILAIICIICVIISNNVSDIK